jgi:glycosyltransferase involved in cell wall biosynthesis
MKVSVCIPTYNQAQYLPQAIYSAFRQDMPPYEIIVYDDCSTDNTAEVLDALAKKIPSLKVLRQTANQGIAKNTDDCLREATGEFIIRLDSDDYLSPAYISVLSELLSKHALAGYAHAGVQEIDEKDNHLNQRRLFRASGYQSSSEALVAAIKGYRVAANIIMFRKSALIKVNYIANRPNYTEDYHLSAALAAAGFGNVYQQEILSYYRVWLDTGNSRKKRKMMEIVGVRKVFEEVIEPAYKINAWSLDATKKWRNKLARKHADCLGWKVYSQSEKQQLAIELRKLSSSFNVDFFIFSYLHGLGIFFNIYTTTESKLKFVTKRILLFFKNRTSAQ